MLHRNMYSELELALNIRQILVITGMRRVGKTTTVKHLLSKIESYNKKYFDLERVELRMLFKNQNYENIVHNLKYEGLDFNQKVWIAIDEIQLVPEITSVIKYLYDTYDVKFIVTSSSSFYLKNHFTESLAGRKRVFELFPLTFDEYLRFNEVQIPLPGKQFEKCNPFLASNLHSYYIDYIEYGGFPEVVLTKNQIDKTALLRDIINSYLQIDIKFLADFRKVDEIYKVIVLLSSRVGSKTDFTKLSVISGINRQLLKEYLLFFEQTYLIRQIPALVKNADREIALQKKLYFTDNGILNVLGKPDTGAKLENSMVNQLSSLGEVRYYSKRTGQEIDFILNEKIAIEVKETPHLSDLKVLKHRATQLSLSEFYLVGLHQPASGFSDFVWSGNI